MVLTPFPLPNQYRNTLGGLPSCGFWKLDIRVNGKWDGVVAVTPDFAVSGVYIRGNVETWDLPFSPDDIEAVRLATIWNRTLSRFPDIFLFGFPYSSILLICPALLVAGFFFNWAFFIASIVTLFGAVLVVGYVGRAGGYCLTGGPLVFVALLQFAIGVLGLYARL